ncbi:CHASE2 domain-containing sensor protein [Dysgonomonadaceae bacterium PH5-43]|nr:CHASE2 domain-containing sensor protein [Dysgonomonadaceae bacterium PH5-43]
MKKTITLVVLVLLTLTVQAKDKSFYDEYLKIRTVIEDEDEEDGIFVQKFNEKEIKKQIYSIDEKEKEKEAALGDKLLREAKQLTVVMDMNEEALPSVAEFNKLLKPYEELVAFNEEETVIGIFGKMKKDKAKELLIFVRAEDAVVIFVNIVFKKPISLDFLLEDEEALKSIIQF